jgi:hypothetical protein
MIQDGDQRLAFVNIVNELCCIKKSVSSQLTVTSSRKPRSMVPWSYEAGHQVSL